MNPWKRMLGALLDELTSEAQRRKNRATVRKLCRIMALTKWNAAK